MAFLQKARQGISSTIYFFADSFNELKKVKWPSRKELTSYTLVVLVTVIFVTLYFVVLDFGISELLRLIFE